MNLNVTIRYLAFLLFFTAFLSCAKTEEQGKKKDDGIKIENLETRLRIAVPDSS